MKVSVAASQLNIYCNKNLRGETKNPIFHPEEFAPMKFHQTEFFFEFQVYFYFLL